MSANDLQLAALLCSRVCHDLISPVGAIANGLEVLNDDDDEMMREHAMSLIQSSAQQASAKLQFARLAFGAAGTAGDLIDLGDARQVTQGLLESGKIELEWPTDNQVLPKDAVKLLLNLILIGIDSIPRGGCLRVASDAEDGELSLEVRAEGLKAKIPEDVKEVLLSSNTPALEDMSARSIQPHLSALVARQLGVHLSVQAQDDTVAIAAKKVA